MVQTYCKEHKMSKDKKPSSPRKTTTRRKKVTKPAKAKGGGRPKGVSPKDPPVLFDRWLLLFYTTKKNEAGNVVGRDYSQSLEHLKSAEKKRLGAIRGDYVLFMSAVKSASWKEDVLKVRTDLIALDADHIEDSEYQIKALRGDSLENLERECIAIQQYLTSEGLNDVAAGLIKKWGSLSASPQPARLLSKEEAQLKQLKAFKW